MPNTTGKWNEATRVQMPALVHLTRIGYSYYGKITEDMQNDVYDPDTNILLPVFKEQFSKLNPSRGGEAETVLKQIRQELDKINCIEGYKNMQTLGTLTEITDLRTVWPHEATDFSPWLANNIERLNEALGIQIVIQDTESPVGNFAVDIYATDADTGKRIIIENQLEQTDHDHLGKLITYASGKDASLIIWVVKHAREEHRASIEWLNAHTDEDIGFILIELKLYRIGNSDVAPFFQVLERPNNWAKEMKTSGITHRKLPRITDMLRWGVVKAGDEITADATDDSVVLQANGYVKDSDGTEMSLQKWLQNVTGWTSVETYRFAIHKATGKTLSAIRREYMDQHPDE